MPEALIGTPDAFLRLLVLDTADLDSHADAIPRLRAGDLTAVVVRDVYPADLMQSISLRLEQHDPPFVRTEFPEKFRSWFYGVNLNLLQSDPAVYFEQAARFHRQLNLLFDDCDPLPGRIADVLSLLDEGRPAKAAPGRAPDETYFCTTLRGHDEGGYIPPHCDNEAVFRPSYVHLRSMTDQHMYSFVLLISEPDAGGRLRVFDHRTEPDSAEFLNHDGAPPKPDPKTLGYADIDLRPGDLVVLDSGRYLHEVTPVRGARRRWTACSFMAHATDRRAVYCWG